MALKVHVHELVGNRELPFYKHLATVLPHQHEGAKHIRGLLTSFQVAGPHGSHDVLVFQVSQMSVRDMDLTYMSGRGFDEWTVQGAIKQLLVALDFLHTEVGVVHTGIKLGSDALGGDTGDAL